MAERIKDKEDLKLDAMFRSGPLPDDGFSVKVMSRVRHRMWVQRLSLPVGIAVGALFGAKPLLQILNVVPGLVNSVFGSSLSFDSISMANVPQLSTVLIGATLVMAMFFASRILEE